MDLEKQRFSVSLKPSLLASSDAGLLHSLFADLEFAAQLRSFLCFLSFRIDELSRFQIEAPNPPNVSIKRAILLSRRSNVWLPGYHKGRASLMALIKGGMSAHAYALQRVSWVAGCKEMTVRRASRGKGRWLWAQWWRARCTRARSTGCCAT